jgi:hypothetical protein
MPEPCDDNRSRRGRLTFAGVVLIASGFLILLPVGLGMCMTAFALWRVIPTFAPGSGESVVLVLALAVFGVAVICGALKILYDGWNYRK